MTAGTIFDKTRTSLRVWFAADMRVMGELVYLFNVRHFSPSAFTRDMLTGNPVALRVSALWIVFQLLFTYAPPMQQHSTLHRWTRRPG